jgi:Zn-dependent peptidase ImmA (M78 family)/DNA-binding XRE family transcriptional regulator
MELKNIFGARLKNARIINGMSMDDLCAKMKNLVSKQTISKYESGKMLPNSTNLIALANALNVKPDYLLRPFTVSLDRIEFRKKSKMSVKEERAIKEKIRDKIERYIEVEEILGISSDFTNPIRENSVIAPSDVYRIAEQLKAAWQLGHDGIPYIIEMLEDHCVKVIEMDAPNTFDGLSGIIGDSKPIIVLNKNFPVERKRFTAMHELGHLLLDFDDALPQKDVERFCNLFANEMLISLDVFKKLLGISRHDISLNELRAIQSNFGISVEAQMFKAKQLGIISESRYKYFCISKNQNPAFREQVEKSTFHEEKSTRFASLVYRALASELISFSKASELLNESIYIVREQLELV